MVNSKKAVSLEFDNTLIIKIIFQCGEIRELDIEPYCSGNVFRPFIEDRNLFKSATIDELGGIEWRNGACLSPETVNLKSKEVL